MKYAPQTFSRRKMLLMGGAALALAGGAGKSLYSGRAIAASHLGHVNPLAIPPQVMGKMNGAVREYDLAVQTGKTEFFAGLKTDTMGINGSYLGPTLRFRKGERIRINAKNMMKTDTTLHWHGFNLPANTDGGPHQVIRPGTTWSPEFEVLERASTMWYHSHLMHQTAPQVWAGLAGMILVDDDESQALGLPDTYGVDDVPVVLQDRTFMRNGSMPYSPGMHFTVMGMTGDTPMVNGTIAPYFEVTSERVRLRILNGSNGSIYTLGFDDGRSFTQIASDGGLLAKPYETNALLLAPGERADILLSMTPGERTILRNMTRGSGGMGMGMMGGGNAPQFDFLELRAASDLTQARPVPATLASLADVDASQATKTRKFVLNMASMGPSLMMAMATGGGFTVNGESMDINVINHVIKKGETELWQISNTSNMAHPFHIHNTQFRILSRDGRPPALNEAGLKDTVLVQSGERVEILIRFDNYTDPDIPYMYHCHILEHEDAGMMGQFTVV